MGAHHLVVGPCPLCETKLQDAHPELRRVFTLVRKQFPDCHVSWTFRGEADQKQACLDGRSRLEWPNSAHNAMKDGKPCARAMDLFQLRLDNVAAWQRSYFVAVSSFLASNCTSVFWGGNFKSLGDLDHFQLHPIVP